MERDGPPHLVVVVLHSATKPHGHPAAVDIVILISFIGVTVSVLDVSALRL